MQNCLFPFFCIGHEKLILDHISLWSLQVVFDVIFSALHFHVCVYLAEIAKLQAHENVMGLQ